MEELESANEELKSANEELQSMNEESQSANEELETSKEEMQSLNEEWVTVNTELNEKIEQLSRSYDDMQNLLNSIDVATLFLDSMLRIKRYTHQARELIHLVKSDIGRPLADLALHAQHPDILKDRVHVLQTLERREKQVQASDGSWHLMRIFPYRTYDNVVKGVVLTFIPIDQLKRAEGIAHDAEIDYDCVVDTVREPLIMLDEHMRIRAANEPFYQTFKVEVDPSGHGRRGCLHPFVIPISRGVYLPPSH